MARFPSELTGYQQQKLTSPNTGLSATHPHAHRVIERLQRAGFSIQELDFHKHAVWIKLRIPANLFVYNRSGKVLVQGAAWEHGRWGEALKKVLPSNTIWQLRL
jgi:hypothetical protein